MCSSDLKKAEERILQRVTSPEVSKFYNDFHSKKGVRIICNAKVTNLNAENQIINSVSLESGESLAADIFLHQYCYCICLLAC